VPVVGDEPRDGWLETLNEALYPAIDRRRTPLHSSFRSKDSVLNRPHDEPASAETVCPGLHRIGRHEVVWWDPRALHLGATPVGGLRHADLIARKDVAPEVIASGLAEYRTWRESRALAVEAGSTPSLRVQTMTRRALIASRAASDVDIDVITVGAAGSRPGGRRYGTLVHSVLAAAPFDADASGVRAVAASQGRAVGALAEEIDAAIACVTAVLRHPLFDRVRAASAAGRCRREVPVAWRTSDDVLLEGTVDLAFEEPQGWVIVDFKTDEANDARHAAHRRQLELYARAIADATSRPVSGVLLYTKAP
jgi:hypothetical protein